MIPAANGNERFKGKCLNKINEFDGEGEVCGLCLFFLGVLNVGNDGLEEGFFAGEGGVLVALQDGF